MAVKVRIPTPLQKLTNQNALVEIQAATVRELMEALEKNYPGIKERLCEPSGKIRRFVNVYLNEEDIRFLSQEDTSIKDGDEISIVPAIAGGR
ncbi:MAG: MoaD/ThiS family protein [Candidatus Omnitrophica bacterium]|nr:MoaD/ThiS family protein [Candidatus Omnitrophota bacterium]